MSRALRASLVIAAWLAAGCDGCVPRFALACDDDLDCLSGQICTAGLCTLPELPGADAGPELDDAGPADDDAGPDDDAGIPDEDAGPVADGGPPLDWFDTAWTRRVAVTFDRPPGETLVDVPVLIVLDASVLDLTGLRADGADLRFVLPDNATVLAHEVEDFDAAGRSFVWVKVPVIDGVDATGFIWVYFGNGGAPDAQNAAAVWSNGFLGVWHLRGDPAAGPGNQPDSTASDVDGTALGMGSAQRVDGQVGAALSFDGADVVRIDGTAAAGPFVPIGALTISAWVLLPFDTDGTIVARREGGLAQWQLQLEHFGAGTTQPSLIWTDDAFGQCIFAADVGLGIGDWHHLAVTMGADGQPGGFFIDGTRVSFSSLGFCGGLPLAVATDVAIGARWAGIPTPGFPLAGQIDEVRVEGEARSDAWIAAQVRAMRGDFVTFNAVESLP